MRSQRRSLSTVTNLTFRNSRRSPKIDHRARRSLHDEPSVKPEQSTLSRTAIDNYLLRTEFEENRDIREYLRKWQAQNVNYMDPVRGPDTSNPAPSDGGWKGNMLNDNLASFDEAVERAQSAVEEGSDFDIQMNDSYETGEILEPGDLVGFFSGVGLMTPAIYIRSLERQKQFYSLRGKWRIASDRDIDVVIKKFASKEETEALIPFLPTTIAATDIEMQALTEGGVPRSVGEPLISKLQDFDYDIKAIYREKCKRLDKAYSLLAHSKDRCIYTLQDMACKVLDISEEEVTPAELFATHQAILRSPYLIMSDRSSIFTDKYTVQPKTKQAAFDTVVQWIRDHEEYQTKVTIGFKKVDFSHHPMQKFLSKAQRLIQKSREIRSPTTMANVGPCSRQFEPSERSDGRVYSKVKTEQFSKNDNMILEYLQYYTFPRLRMTTGLPRYGAVHIMRATGMYATADIQRGVIPLFLQELGVISPWENVHILDHSLALPSHDIDSCRENNTAGDQEVVQYKKDAMENSRVDWGDLPIYCIDDPGAKEIDDGISLEPVPGSDDTFWVRVHIANPSAFVPFDDPVSKYASECISTVYLPERTYPMIPPEITQESFSLAPGRPTLTISAKVNIEGEVLETNITNGYARNVVYLTHHRLRRVFGAGEDLKVFTVGGEVPSKPEEHYKETLTKEEEDKFHILRNLMTKINLKWRENGGLTWPDSFGKQNPRVYTGERQIEPHEISEVTHGGYYLGDPVIGLQWNGGDPYDIPDLGKMNLVALVMRFACHVAGRWGAERNIPLVYDGTFYHPEYPPLTPAKLKSFEAADWLRFAPPKGHSASNPLVHHGLGVDVYTKATSPLRRYTDLLAHYQIEAALRYEQEHGEKFDAKKTPSALPFSTQDVDQVLERMESVYPVIKNLQNFSNTSWACQFLFRAFYFGQCKLPATFPCMVRQRLENISTLGTKYVGAYAGENLPFGMRARLFVSQEFDDLDLLGTVEAKIIAVDMSLNVIDMEVVRKVKKWERKGDWA
ncbi:uncharacterized protein TRUGW13939_02146 [Talaromyces rugulosus]|uniref:RNB domain-containing protein n=1 Tax=Talaromyces rugulosus TaxID=121627 RepID=A0A7H8QMD3_TALRU|nr:uncharacterized protein TRUGW13939_02146 [Talaromyces rugulosus]QKX55054.1 hypothetical protein TRUGW13939_02146 [Talaromyces rugulosus]